MNELDEAGRALLALAGDAHDPTDVDRARVRTALAARLGTAAGIGAVAGITATAKAAAGAGSVGATSGATAAVTGGALATKVVAVAVALTATVGVGATVRLTRRAAHAPAVQATTEVRNHRPVAMMPRKLFAPAQEQAPVEAPWPAPRTLSESEPARRENPPSDTPAEPAPSVEPPAGAPARRQATEAAAKMDVPGVPVTARPRPTATAAGANNQACLPTAAGADRAARRSESAVADEARLIHDGVSALRAGQPACALSLLDTHARFYPQGVLAEERDAERALALAALGRVAEARAAATAFLRQHPASPLGVRLRERIPEITGAGQDPTGTPTPGLPPR